ncbi:hypothetical protein AVEN_250332-1 [Araneus ventricosus]|uniref:Uncharacterized protein n=1 Tax=Araneus ventricosus TaxID=182803 RepID=A0A4Y2UQL9_ARAVE|nr:hypothetical protein AVEN_250332-1 [Araneus ventricosus]
MRITRHRISSQRKPPSKESQYNIEHQEASSKRNFMLSTPNRSRINATTVPLEGYLQHPSKSQVFPSSVPKTRNHICNGTCLITNLRDLILEQSIAVVMARWEALRTAPPSPPLPAHFILPSPQTT